MTKGEAKKKKRLFRRKRVYWEKGNIKKIKKSKKVEYNITANTLRPRNNMKFIWRTNRDKDLDDGDDDDDDDDYDDYDSFGEKKRRKKKVKRDSSERKSSKKEYSILDFEDVYEDESIVQRDIIEEALNKIPKNRKELRKLYDKVTEKVVHYKELFMAEQLELASEKILFFRNSVTLDRKGKQNPQRMQFLSVLMLEPLILK